MLSYANKHFVYYISLNGWLQKYFEMNHQMRSEFLSSPYKFISLTWWPGVCKNQC